MTFGNKYSNAVRVLGVDQIRQAKSGHTGIVLGASDVVTELYKNHLVFNPNDPKWWFTTETQEATVWLVQHLMQELNIPIQNVLRHYDIVSKVCPAPYVANNKYRTSWTWTEFLAKVQGKELKYYRVRRSWDDEKSQIGAYLVLENAMANCPPGYSVYDNDGKELHHEADVEAHTNPFFQGMDEKQRAEAALEIIHNTDKSGILWSVTCAQWILESGYGKTTLAIMAENYFGMKSNLSSNTWKSVWDGHSVYTVNTQEDDGTGRLYTIKAAFRKYPDMEHSIMDHAGYLLGAEKAPGEKRYAGLTDAKNYREAITIIKNGGYATDTKYIDKICNIIQRFNLNRYDHEVTKPEEPEPAQPQAAPIWYRVRLSWLDSTSQLGAFTELDNAKKCADQNPGYKVFDDVGNLVFDPVQNGQFPFTVRVEERPMLRIRKEPSLTADIVGIISPGIYTIVASHESDHHVWGKLKSGVGWIALEYVTKLAKS